MSAYIKSSFWRAPDGVLCAVPQSSPIVIARFSIDLLGALGQKSGLSMSSLVVALRRRNRPTKRGGAPVRGEHMLKGD